MLKRRTDLAAEAAQLWQEEAGQRPGGFSGYDGTDFE